MPLSTTRQTWTFLAHGAVRAGRTAAHAARPARIAGRARAPAERAAPSLPSRAPPLPPRLPLSRPVGGADQHWLQAQTTISPTARRVSVERLMQPEPTSFSLHSLWSACSASCTPAALALLCVSRASHSAATGRYGAPGRARRALPARRRCDGPLLPQPHAQRPCARAVPRCSPLPA